MMTAGLLRSKKITAPADYKLVFERGRSVSDGLLRLTAAARADGDAGGTRYGLSVSKRVGNAVTRNLVKRRLRTLLQELPAAERELDVIVTVWPRAATADFEQLRDSLRGLARRAKIL